MPCDVTNTCQGIMRVVQGGKECGLNRGVGGGGGTGTQQTSAVNAFRFTRKTLFIIMFDGIMEVSAVFSRGGSGAGGGSTFIC